MTELDHGELKREIAARIGSDPERYGTGIGTERHRCLTADEITKIGDCLGLGFLADERKQTKMDTIMLKLGRDHRTGASRWDVSDLAAVRDRLETDTRAQKVRA